MTQAIADRMVRYGVRLARSSQPQEDHMLVNRYSIQWAALRDVGYVEARYFADDVVLMLKGAA